MRKEGELVSYILRTNHLTKRYGAKTVVNDVNMTITSGDIYGFLGQNGAGKTTTLRMMMGLIHPSAGDIELFGASLHRGNRKALERIGSIIEYPGFYLNLSAADNLDIHRRLTGMGNKERIDDALATVGLLGAKHQKVKQFSLGMKQRLGIARALLHQPELLLLDEPANGLDPGGIKEMRQLFLELAGKRGITFLISSHLLSEVELMKLKNTKMHWLVLLGAIPANLIALSAFLPRVTPEGVRAGIDLQDMFYRQGMVITILGPFMFALMTGYIISREYQERTINQLFSCPIPRVRMLLAKLAAVLVLIVITSALSCVTVTATALVMLFAQSVDAAVIWPGIRMNALACLLSFGTVPVAAALSMVGKSVIPSTVLGVFATVVTLIGEMGHGMRGILFPWLMPYWPVRELARGLAESGPNPYVASGIAILAATFIVSLVFCIVYYEKSEIHSGS